MSKSKKCPKCGGEMEKGTLFGDSKVMVGPLPVKFTNKFSSSILLIGKKRKIFAFACKVCGYTEIYREMNEP
jgi:predicted nucleic-acid-binding Zn-ribbon protein